MAAIKIVLADGRTAFEPGETITGRAAWDLPKEPSAVEIRLLWYTMGKGTTDVSVVQTVPLEGQGGHWGDAPFSITAPEAPWSCSGSLVSVQWTLELVAEPSDENDSVELVIAPGARAVRLGTPEPEDGENPREEGNGI